MSATLLTNPALNTRVTTFDTIGRQYFNLFPLPTRTAFTNDYTTAPRNTQFSKTADERLDHHFGDGDLVYLRYTSSGVDTNIGSLFLATGFAAGTIFPGGNLAGSTGPATARAHQARLNCIHTFTPNLLLELKAGYTLLSNAQYPLNYGNAINITFRQSNINVSDLTTRGCCSSRCG